MGALSSYYISLHALYFARCGFCSVEYSSILKLENLNEELFHVFERVGLAHILPMEATIIHRNDNSKEDFDKTAYYMSQIDPERIMKLYDLYKMDFEMFDYSVAEYFQ